MFHGLIDSLYMLVLSLVDEVYSRDKADFFFQHGVFHFF